MKCWTKEFTFSIIQMKVHGYCIWSHLARRLIILDPNTEENNLTKSKLRHLSGCPSTFREVILHNVDTFIRMLQNCLSFKLSLKYNAAFNICTYLFQWKLSSIHAFALLMDPQIKFRKTKSKNYRTKSLISFTMIDQRYEICNSN